jgi:hypothetical protein
MNPWTHPTQTLEVTREDSLIKSRETIISWFEASVEELFSKLPIEELEEIQWEINESNERNLDTKEYASFTNIIWPLLGITNYHIWSNLKAIVTRFWIKLKVTIRLKRWNENTIKDFVITRLSWMKWFETISGYFDEVNLATNVKWLERTKYTILAKGIEKVLRKFILLFHSKEFTMKNPSNTAINANFDNIINFLEDTLKIHNKNYIQPLRDLHAFNNTEKHNISSRGKIDELDKYDYSWIIEFFIDLIESTRSK